MNLSEDPISSRQVGGEQPQIPPERTPPRKPNLLETTIQNVGNFFKETGEKAQYAAKEIRFLFTGDNLHRLEKRTDLLLKEIDKKLREDYERNKNLDAAPRTKEYKKALDLYLFKQRVLEQRESLNTIITQNKNLNKKPDIQTISIPLVEKIEEAKEFGIDVKLFELDKELGNIKDKIGRLANKILPQKEKNVSPIDTEESKSPERKNTVAKSTTRKDKEVPQAVKETSSKAQEAPFPTNIEVEPKKREPSESFSSKISAFRRETISHVRSAFVNPHQTHQTMCERFTKFCDDQMKFFQGQIDTFLRDNKEDIYRIANLLLASLDPPLHASSLQEMTMRTLENFKNKPNYDNYKSIIKAFYALPEKQGEYLVYMFRSELSGQIEKFEEKLLAIQDAKKNAEGFYKRLTDDSLKNLTEDNRSQILGSLQRNFYNFADLNTKVDEIVGEMMKDAYVNKPEDFDESKKKISEAQENFKTALKPGTETLNKLRDAFENLDKENVEVFDDLVNEKIFHITKH